MSSIQEKFRNGSIVFVIDPDTGECFDGVVWRSFTEFANSTSVVVRFLEPCVDFNLEVSCE